MAREVPQSNMSNYEWRPVLEWIDPDIIPSTGPGSSTLIKGHKDIDYYGAVSSAELISGNALATLVGLTEGTLMNDTTDWLKFSHRNTILYIPQKPIRNNMTSNNL